MKRLFNAVFFSTAAIALATTSQAEAAQVKEVTFESNGQTMIGDLYLPDAYVTGQELPGVIVTGSWTSVKEQMSGLYAEALGDRGYAALAFDFRNFGESEGEVRALESASMKIAEIRSFAHCLQQCWG